MREQGWVGPRGDLVQGVERIAVLRGGGLGDLLFAMPAMEALAAAYPGARLTLLGTPLHAELLAARPGPVAEVEILPATEGIRAGVDDPPATDRFLHRMQECGFDLALQLHGGGRFSNPFLARLGARVTAGLRTPDAAELDRFVPYQYYQHEMLRALEVVGLLGAAPVLLEPVIPVSPGELARGFELVGEGPVLAIHPGATDPRRRWPAQRFGEIAKRVVAEGARVVVVGDSSDTAAADEIVAIAGSGAASLAGRLSLGELVGVLAAVGSFVGNDSGPRHLAQAVGCSTVAIYWVGNLVNAGPLGRSRHRVHVSWTTSCPVCGRDSSQVGWKSERCEHDVSFVADVGTEEVYADVAELMARTLPVRGR